MPDDQIQNHRGSWVKAEVAEALQVRVTELTAEVQELRAQLEAAKTPAGPSQQH
jgi:hypothetical protein